VSSTHVGSDVENVTRGSAGHQLVGNARANKLSGHLGDDQLTGRGGSDRLFGGDGDDSLDGRDDARDSLHCSEDIDTALRGWLDWVSSACENR
jgi:Ca2+-binding RTX toxin-like protein